MTEQIGEKEKIPTIKERLVKSGIAERIINTIKKYKGTMDPEITFGIEDCDFKVEQVIDIYDQTHTDIVIVMPNLNLHSKEKQPMIEQNFVVVKDNSFGAGSETPLTQEQFDLVQKIVEEQSNITDK